MRGTLFLVVGPSGAGKDSLIAAARGKLPERFAFPCRVITRAAEVSESHEACMDDEFARREARGEFALSWQAHGMRYGVPAFETALAAGRHVVVNVSRDVVEAARTRFNPIRVIEVTAPTDMLAARLKARGREDVIAIDERLSRVRAVRADATVVNDGALEASVAAFVRALQG